MRHLIKNMARFALAIFLLLPFLADAQPADKPAVKKEAAAKKPKAPPAAAKEEPPAKAAKKEPPTKAAKAVPPAKAAKDDVSEEAAKLVTPATHVHPKMQSMEKRAIARNKYLAPKVAELRMAKPANKDARRDERQAYLKKILGDAVNLPAVHKELRQMAWIEARLVWVLDLTRLANDPGLLKIAEKLNKEFVTYRDARLKTLAGGK